MGTLVGHVAPGLGFFLLGLWHLFNQIKIHSRRPNTYNSTPWFPTSKIRYIELYFIMTGSSISVAMELFVAPKKHQPLDTDGTIPSSHLHNFEHSLISMTFFVYATFAIILDKISPKTAKHGLTQLIAVIAFAQEILLFHLHSTDHMGLEGQYHWLLQLVIFVSLSTTILGIGLPKSFLVGFVRSFSILFQGVWFIVLGFTLYTPAFIPKGCYLYHKDGRILVACHTQEALHRAKSLVNIQFSSYLILSTILCMSFYLILIRIYRKRVIHDVHYPLLTKGEEEEEEEEDLDDDVEFQKPSTLGHSKNFIFMSR
ncbi:transmembrane protein 45A-like [Tripterygium wilfordii]|uniref:transmembrane protein 45A-like n=1 Tax=Tripterygium wilfordii TaxID=458696 RepID=UPI0018F83A55|nr:transmembrane protein 45A-like [Tripterygium wilfordii]